MINYCESPAIEEPISLFDAKVVCAIDPDLIDEDTHIYRLIRAARLFVQNDLTAHGNPLLLARETWVNGWGYWPRHSWVQLVKLPAVSVVSVAYHDANFDQMVEMDLGDFYLDPYQSRVLYTPGAWPLVSLGLMGLRATFTCGYDKNTVAPELKQAMLSLIGHWFINREAVVAGTEYRAEAAIVPYGYSDLVAPYRSRRVS